MREHTRLTHTRTSSNDIRRIERPMRLDILSKFLEIKSSARGLDKETPFFAQKQKIELEIILLL